MLFRSISRQIKALEEHLDLALFRRLHRALRLTEEGQTLYQAVGDVLAQLHEVAARLRRRPENRTVVVTTTPEMLRNPGGDDSIAPSSAPNETSCTLTGPVPVMAAAHGCA